MRLSIALLVLLACGGNQEDEVLEAELAAEASAGDEDTESEGADLAARYRAEDSRVFEACYDDLEHLDEHARRRRELRVRRIRPEAADAETPTGIEVDRGPTEDEASDELPSNTDVDPHPHSPEEQAIIALEERVDAFHAERPHLSEWSMADLDAYEDLADELHDACMRVRRGG